MSSYYTAAQLEAMRKEKLKRELSDAVQKLKEQLQVEHANDVQMTERTHIELSVFAADHSAGGYDHDAVITGSTLQKTDKHSTEKRDELDFSELLFPARKRTSRLELELDEWIRKVEQRPVMNERDASDRSRLLSELTKTLQASDMDIEDKIRSVKMRITSYLQGASKLTEADKADLESEYYQYCALCSILGDNPTEKYPYRIKKEIERMTEVLEKRSQNRYIMDVIEDVMEELGCHVQDDAVLDHVIGQMFSVDGHPLCDIFVGSDGSGIMFEPIVESKEGSLEKRRQVEDSANSICALYRKLEEKAAERGVILRRVYLEPAHLSSVCAQTDISERHARKRQRKTVALKQQAIGPEG